MHFRTTIRREIAARLAAVRTDLVVREGTPLPFDDESFLDANGDYQAQVIVATTDLRASAPEGLVIMGSCLGGGAPIPVELAVEVQLFLKMAHGDAPEETLDEIEADFWPALMVNPLSDIDVAGRVLDFESELTQSPDPKAEQALWVRVLRFAVRGEFDPADPSTLRAQAR